MPELFWGTIPMVLVIAGLVEAAKRYLGLPVRFAPWINLALSAFFYAVIGAAQLRPEMQEPLTLAFNVLVLFLGTAGLYDRAQAITRKS